MKTEIVETKTLPSLQFWSRVTESSFVAYYDGIVSNAVIFLPGMENLKSSSVWNQGELMEKKRLHVTLSQRSAARTTAILPGVVQHLKPQPLRHVQLQEFQHIESLCNEEFLSMVRTLVLDYKDFLEDQLSSLMNLTLFKREHSLSAAYNQAMVATMGPSDVESLVNPHSDTRHLALSNKGLPFVAFYDGTAKTSVVFLPGAVEQTNTLITKGKGGPFVAFYDGMIASAQIFLPGAVQQSYALIPSNGTKAVVSAQQLKPQPIRHVQLQGYKNMESLCNEEFLSMVRRLLADYKDFLEDQLSNLLNLALLKREHSLSAAYNQTMLATRSPSDVESLVSPPSNPRHLATLPFIAFYEGIAATAVVFLPGHVTIPVTRPCSPQKSTRMEIKSRQDIVHNDGILATANVFLPFLQKETQSEVHITNPRPPARPQWSRVEKCRLLKDKLDGLPLRYKPRATKYVAFEEKEIDLHQRILNTIPSMKTISPGTCLAQSPLTPHYWFEDAYPDMVSASLKELAMQHMKYFRASPSRAPGRRTGRTQIQILEDLYWEKLRKMDALETADEIVSRRQQEMCFNRKLWYGSVIKTKLKSDHNGKSMFSSRAAQLNDTARLNTNNNGYTKEEGDCNLDTTDSSVFGSKSDQRFSKGQDIARKKHSYRNKRHSDGYRSHNRGREGVDGTCADFNKKDVEQGSAQNFSGKDTDEFTDSPPVQCQMKDSNLAQREPEKNFNLTDHGFGRMSLATHELSTSGYDGKLFAEALFQEGTLEDDAVHLKELLKDVSNFNSLCDVPESILQRVALLTCKQFLKGGYSSGLCFLSKLIDSPESCPLQPTQNLEQCVDRLASVGSAAVSATDSPTEMEEDNMVQNQRDVLYREAFCMRLEQFPVFEVRSTNDDDFMGDLSFTENSPDDRTESPHSFLHDDFIHEDDVLDIPTLSIMSPSRASLGQAYHSHHDITSLSTLDHDKDKPASHEPFPSEYVFRRVCGPSFSVSSEFWHIEIPTLPSEMVDYKVESDGLTEVVIGSGCFGEVYAATLTVYPGQSRDVVVKEHFTDKTTQESVAEEAKITMYLESTGCVPICYGLLGNEEDGFNIVMEYVGTGQTLYDLMRESELPRLHWLNIVCQLTSGLNKIHKKDVLINDIKSDNILVDMSGEVPLVKFCDMGTASYKAGVTYRGPMENCVHLAPEACAHAETTPACDVYSLGRVLKKIHGVSHISTLWAVAEICQAEDPADRPTIEAINQLFQEEYTREVLFPTLTVPSHDYIYYSDEESLEESAGSILRVNTPVDRDPPTAAGTGSAEVNALPSDNKSNSCSQRSDRVSPSKDQALVTTISELELDTSSAAANPVGIQDISISIDHVPYTHVPGSSHTVLKVNMPRSVLSSAEITDTSVVASKCAQRQTETLVTEAVISKSAQSGRTGMADIVDVATSKSAQDGNVHLDTLANVGTCEVPSANSSPIGSYGFYAPSVPTSSPASSWASCHLHTTSASSMEVSLGADSPKASSGLHPSPSHSQDASSSETFLDAVEDDPDDNADPKGHHTDADVNEAAAVPVVVDVDGRATSPSLESPHVAEYRALCQAELEVYNKYCEDTPMYQDYLPLVLPLIMLPLGFFGLI